MRIHAYVLAADPTWLRRSVQAYYDRIEKLVVAYDERDRGWTGSPVAAEECRGILRSLDVDGKIEWLAGDFAARGSEDYVGADTRQRRAALACAAAGADWVLQIDTDEFLPHYAPLQDALNRAEAEALRCVEWPMRVLFRRLVRGGYLEVVTDAGTTHFEYPGPIAVRPDVELVECRRTDSPYLRPLVAGDMHSLQLRQPASANEHRMALLRPDEAIIHNSWARSPRDVRRKVASWSHNRGKRSAFYYYAIWLPAPVTWRVLRRFHPLHAPLWPRLRTTDDPFAERGE